MKAADLALDELLDSRPEEGRLTLRGGRALLSDAAATYRLAEELCETLGEEAAWGVLTRFGYQSGYQDAVRLRTYFVWDSDFEWLSAAARIQTLLGIGRLELSEVVVDRSEGVFRVVANVTGSFEAEEHKERIGPSDAPCCHRLTGYLSGYASAFFGDQVLFRELSCAGSSDDEDACRLEGKLRDAWGSEADREGARYRKDKIGERLAQRDREVLAQAVQIREQELEILAKKRLEEASRLKTEFLANISHELRTPLNSIIGYSDILITRIGAKLPATPRRNLERILHNAEHLLGLINSILDISKIEAGRMDVRLQDVDVGPMLETVLEDTRARLGDRPVEVSGVGLDALPAVRVDPVRLLQCLTNVCSNAAKFTERGSVRVSARQVRSYRDGSEVGFLALVVTDTGRGIPASDLAVIFEPFRQVDGTTSRDHEGTGLGLPIVRQLLGLMGGEVQVQSEVGAGSTFTLILPLASGEAPTRDFEDPDSLPERMDSVLLIEDDEDFQAIVGEFMRSTPALSSVALRVERDPVKALADARNDPPGLILLDLRLPHVDGREVLRLLKTDERTASVPVVVISARDDLESTLDEGALATLTKPLDRAPFAQIVAAALGRDL